MSQRRFLVTSGCLILLSALICLVVGSACAKPATPAPAASPAPASKAAPAAPEKIQIRLGTSTEGTATYALGIVAAKCISDRVPNVKIVAVPTAGADASLRLFSKGELEASAASVDSLYESHLNTGAFEKQPLTWKPYQTNWWSTGDHMLVTRKDRTDIKTYKDLVGKKLFPLQAGTSSFDLWKKALTAIDLWNKVEIRQMDYSAASDALKSGQVDAMAIYTNNAGKGGMPSWVKELTTLVDLKVVPLTDEEIKTIAKVRPIYFWVTSTEAIGKDVGLKELWTFGSCLGWHFGPELKEDIVYSIIKAWFEYGKTDMAAASPQAKYWSENMAQLQKTHMPSIADMVAIHPGAAKYYKEIGIWDNKWQVGAYKERPK